MKAAVLSWASSGLVVGLVYLVHVVFLVGLERQATGHIPDLPERGNIQPARDLHAPNGARIGGGAVYNESKAVAERHGAAGVETRFRHLTEAGLDAYGGLDALARSLPVAYVSSDSIIDMSLSLSSWAALKSSRSKIELFSTDF